MTKEQKLALMNYRKAILSEKPSNIKSGGVLRKLNRQIRNMEKTL